MGKISLGLFKNVYKCVYKSFISNIYMHKEDLTSNNIQWLIYYKTQPNNLNKSNIKNRTEF